MALLFNNAITVATLPTVLEMPNNYAFNGHLYSKTNFNPVPLKFFTGINVGTTNVPIFKRTVSSHPAWTYGKQNNNMEMDVDDPNTYYLIVNDNYGQSLNKITLNSDYTYTITSCNLQASAETNFRASIIDQDSMFIYILKNTGSWSSTACQIVKITKSNMSATVITFPNNTYKAKVILKDANSLYVCTTSSANGVTTHIYRINRADMAITDLIAYTKDYTLQALVTDKVTYEGTSSEAVFYLFNIASTIAEMKKLVIDSTTATLTTTTIPCYEVVGGVEKAINISNAFDIYDYVETINFQVNTNKYIGVFYMNNSLNCISRTTWFLIFKVMGDGRLKLVQRQVYPYAIQGLLEFNDNLNLSLLGRTFIKNLAWDVNYEKFIVGNEINGMFTLIGADENNNLWSFNDNKAIGVHSQYTPSTIAVEFEKENYDFQGSPIGSYVYFYAKNFYGNYVSCSAEITLEGPCKFSDNGTQIIIKTTSTSGKLSIPIEVVDNGVLRVGIRLLQS